LRTIADIQAGLFLCATRWGGHTSASIGHHRPRQGRLARAHLAGCVRIMQCRRGPQVGPSKMLYLVESRLNAVAVARLMAVASAVGTLGSIDQAADRVTSIRECRQSITAILGADGTHCESAYQVLLIDTTPTSNLVARTQLQERDRPTPTPVAHSTGTAVQRDGDTPALELRLQRHRAVFLRPEYTAIQFICRYSPGGLRSRLAYQSFPEYARQGLPAGPLSTTPPRSFAHPGDPHALRRARLVFHAGEPIAHRQCRVCAPDCYGQGAALRLLPTISASHSDAGSSSALGDQIDELHRGYSAQCFLHAVIGHLISSHGCGPQACHASFAMTDDPRQAGSACDQTTAATLPVSHPAILHWPDVSEHILNGAAGQQPQPHLHSAGEASSTDSNLWPGLGPGRSEVSTS